MDGDGGTSTSDGHKQKPNTVSAAEEKELRRVYDRLCDYQVRSRINDEIKDLQAWQHNARVKVKESLAVNVLVDQNQVEANQTATQSRIDELKQKLHELETNPLKSISVGDVADMFKKLGVKVNKKEVEEMVWEVDEDINGHIDWQEFRLMYIRNINDKTGLEPSRMVRVLLSLCVACWVGGGGLFCLVDGVNDGSSCTVVLWGWGLATLILQ